MQIEVCSLKARDLQSSFIAPLRVANMNKPNQMTTIRQPRSNTSHTTQWVSGKRVLRSHIQHTLGWRGNIHSHSIFTNGGQITFKTTCLKMSLSLSISLLSLTLKNANNSKESKTFNRCRLQRHLLMRIQLTISGYHCLMIISSQWKHCSVQRPWRTTQERKKLAGLERKGRFKKHQWTIFETRSLI